MGLVEARRLAALERRAERAARRVATTRLDDDDVRTLNPYAARVVEADEAGVSRPRPNPEEQRALERWADLCEQAYHEGWGRGEAPPGAGRDYFG